VRLHPANERRTQGFDYFGDSNCNDYNWGGSPMALRSSRKLHFVTFFVLLCLRVLPGTCVTLFGDEVKGLSRA